MASSLQNVFQKSFPGNNLLDLSLVLDTDPQLPFYKNRYFFFIGITPGQKNDQGTGRTFVKEGKIQLKVEVEKVLALAHSIRLICDNRVADAKFSIIADSSKSNYGNVNNGIKSIFIGEYIPPAKQDGTPSQKLISFAFKQGANKPIGCTYTISEGYAISDILVHLCKKCMDLEIEAKGLNVGAPIVRNNQPKMIPNGNVNQSGYNPAPQSNPGQVEQNFQNAFQSFEPTSTDGDFNPFG